MLLRCLSHLIISHCPKQLSKRVPDMQYAALAGKLDHGCIAAGVHPGWLANGDEHAARWDGFSEVVRLAWSERMLNAGILSGVLVEAIKTVSTIEREQLEVDFAKRALWDMISKGACCGSCLVSLE